MVTSTTNTYAQAMENMATILAYSSPAVHWVVSLRKLNLIAEPFDTNLRPSK
jgi:hypothetical protein